MNLKLLHQGLILILLPIAFEMAFIPELGNLLDAAERDITAETHALAVIDRANHLIFQFAEAAVAARLHHLFSNQSARDRFQVQIDEIKGNIAELKELVQSNPDEAALFARIEVSTNNMIGTVQRSVNTDFVEGEISYDINFHAQKLAAQLREFINQVQTKRHDTPFSQQKNSRQSVVNFLFIGVATNLLLGLMLAIYFNRATISRLNILMDNTRRLSKREKLLPRIEGTDDIGELDSTFHDMAAALDEAAKKNQELMKTIGQDLRNPLTNIQLKLAALSNGVFGELPAKAQKEVLISEFNSNRLINLISDLVDIEKLDSGKLDIELSSVDLDRILEQSIQVVRAYAGRRQIELTFEPTQAFINGDSNRLVQVLVNLLSNAIKFSPKGSCVTLSAASTDNDVIVKVTDQGRGVPEAFRESIFERFKQVKKEDAQTEHGSGLGLAICKAIIEGHAGTIGVESTASGGSVFWFKIPLAPPAATKSESTND